MSHPKRLSASNIHSRHWFLVLAPLFFVILANALVSSWLEGVIYPSVTVANVSVAGLTRQQAIAKLQSQPLDRNLKIMVDGKEFTASSQQLGAEYDIPATVELAYQVGRDQPLPIIGVWTALSQGELAYAYKLDYKKLNAFTSDVVKSVGQPATSAVVQVKEGQVVVIPDKPGLGIDRTRVTQLVSGALAEAKDATFQLETQSVEAPIKASEVQPTTTSAQQLLGRQVSLTYEGRTFAASPTNIGYWIKVEPDSEVNPSKLLVKVNEQEVRGWVQSVANQVNKNPVNKKVTIKNGVTSVDREGSNGYAVDQEAAVAEVMAAMRDNRDATIGLKTNPVAFRTETTRTTSLDAPRYIEVNLSRQYLWAYENGQVVYSTPVTSGATGAGFPTVTGTFAIYYKARNTYLNGRPYGYNYNVFVQYWMPFYSGYGLHDASWRSSFGGADYYYGGSHGCVNMPNAAAAFLYDWAPVGTPVWVHT
ncbi:MAG: L,D-transpeptidase family protein [Candidatus Saccharibacteria bacterium]